MKNNLFFACRTPESQGVSSRALAQCFRKLAEFDTMNSVMILRHGNVIAQAWWPPYRPEVRHELFSVSKSFTSLGIGLAVCDGLVKLDDLVLDFFPEQRPCDPRFADLTIRHLLTMSSGHSRCPLGVMLKEYADDLPRGFFATPLEYAPGERFVYNSGASYILSDIVTRRTGMALVDYLKKPLLQPLGIHHARWDASNRGVSLGGWGFYLTTEEIARFAQMMLDNGRFAGKQLVPKEYVECATGFQIDTSHNGEPDWQEGYGFQFWRCRHGAFRADGACGQYALMMPEQDMAIAVTAGMTFMQRTLDAIWSAILPACAPEALAADEEGERELAEVIASLHCPRLKESPLPECEKIICTFAPNPLAINRLELTFSAGACDLFWHTPDRVEHWRADGAGKAENDSFLPYQRSRRMTLQAAWRDDHTLQLQANFYETPFRTVYTLRFEKDDTVTLQAASNLNFMREEWPVLTGTVNCK